MSVIKPRTRGKTMLRHVTRLDVENTETLYAYARFLGESTEYVLNEVIDSVLGRDREYLAWRAEHPESCVSSRAATTPVSTTEKSGPKPVAAAVSGGR
jgi:hypothetical protein